jgi:hypothetical protein
VEVAPSHRTAVAEQLDHVLHPGCGVESRGPAPVLFFVSWN